MIIPGDRVIVFDPVLWNNKDVGDNSQFFKPATVVRRYIYISKLYKYRDEVIDIVFDHRSNEISKAHFIWGVKPDENRRKQ